jgi:hypothetical protein
MNHLSSEIRSDIDELIITFSLSFKKIIDQIIDQWLQITQIDLDFSSISKSSDGALFNYSISNVLSMSIQSKIEKNTTYEEFWKVVKDWLFITTDFNLLDVKLKLEDTLIPEFRNIVDDLENNLIAIPEVDIDQITDLLNAIASSRQKLVLSVKEFAKWFCRNESELELNIGIDVVIEIVQRSLSFESENRVNGLIEIPGNMISFYVDIIYILFANAIEHSGLDKENVLVSTEVSSEDDSIEIVVSNSCAHKSDYLEKNEELKKYCDIYSTDVGLDRLSNQGKTGFYKVQKTIFEDLSCNFRCEIYYADSATFIVKVIIKT